MSSVGDIVGGRYAILRVLGSGPANTAYEGENLLMGSRVVVKVLHQNAQDLLEQARRCSRLDHPGIARVLDVSPNLDPPFVVCEKVAGRPFSAAALRAGQPDHREDWTVAVDLTLQVLAALEYAHGHGLVHGALHPNNVLIRYPRPGVPWATITDFSGQCTRAAPQDAQLSAFVAPEVLVGERPTQRSDLFSAAALLRSCLSAAVRVPPEMLSALDAALSNDPALRPAGAGQLAETLSPFLGGSGSNPAAAAPWSRAPNIVYAGSCPPSSAPRSAGRRDSRVTDSLLRNPHFARSADSAPRPPPVLWWRFIAVGLGVGLLATFALRWLVAR